MSEALVIASFFLSRLLLLSGRREFILIQVAIGLDTRFHVQQTFLFWSECYIVQGYDAWHLGQIADKTADIVVAPLDFDRDRQGGIKISRRLGTGTEQIKLQSAPTPT